MKRKFNIPLLIINLILLVTFIILVSTGLYNYFTRANISLTIDLSRTKNSVSKSPDSSIPIEIDDNKKTLALILVGPIGINSNILQSALELPKEIILGISPYSSNLDEIVSKIVSYDHQVFINIPMEPADYPINDPGPYSLNKDRSIEENKNILDSLITKNKLISGIYSDIDEIYTSNQDNFSMILDSLKNNNLNYIYGYGQGNMFCNQVAEKIKYPLISADILIDKIINENEINNQLYNIEKLAKTNKIVIAMARPYPISINLINKWIKTLDKKNIKLVNVSTIINSHLIGK